MEWVSVKNRLPDQDCVCVVTNTSRFGFYIAVYSAYFKEFEVSIIGMSRITDPITFSATHWMALENPQ